MSLLPPQTQKLFDDQIEAMPEELFYVKETLKSFDWQTEISKVAAKYRLSPQQTVQLVVETGMVLIGIANPAEFLSQIQKQISVSLEVAKRIAEDLQIQVFDPLQGLVLNQNRDHIEYLQNRVAQLEHEQGNESLQDVGIEITDEPPVAGVAATIPVMSSEVSTSTPPSAARYVGHDPYHEPVE